MNNYKTTKSMKGLLWIIRIIVGVLFIFSGLIKANDPLGLSYKMDEFFEVLNLHMFRPYSLGLSITMIAFEIIAGVAVIVGYAYRLFAWLLLILIIGFTYLTGFALFSGKIKECGCFGDCIKLTPMMSFTKDILLLVLIGVLLIYRRKVTALLSKKASIIVLLLVTIFSFGVQFYVLKHLPIKDCLAYKAGNNLWEKTQSPPGSIPDEYETILIYKKDGVEKEFTQDNFPWQDTTWVFVDSKTKLVKKGNATPEILDFTLNGFDGTTYTESILRTPGKMLMLYLRNPAKTGLDNIDQLRQLLTDAQKEGVKVYILTSGNQEDTEAWMQKANLQVPDVVTLDGTVSKTAMRSNPGLMYLVDGTVRGKFAPADYPNISDLK
jgi:uncharacterized membrane protein YphA (DoxX/SURF4 family)/peroxiredoxin